MPSFTEVDPDGTPAWWPGGLRAGHAVELSIYGDVMIGRLREITASMLSVTVPVEGQAPGLLLSTTHGTAVISMEGGAARVPVSCWAAGDLVRLQVIGPIQFVQRREYVRVGVRLPVSLGWLRSGGSSWGYARTFSVDLSLGGMRLAPVTTVWPSVGVRVQVLIHFADGSRPVQADVVGTTLDYGLRLHFIDLTPAAAERIRQFTGGELTPGASGEGDNAIDARLQL